MKITTKLGFTSTEYGVEDQQLRVGIEQIINPHGKQNRVYNKPQTAEEQENRIYNYRYEGRKPIDSC